VPIALIAAIGASRVLTDARRPVEAGQREPFDLLVLLLGSGGLVALVTGCGQAASQGWTSGGVLALLLGSVVAFGVFVVREARSSAPLLPLHIVFERRRGAAYLSALLAIAGMFGAFLFLTYDLQVVLGLAPLQAGLAFLPMSASAFVVATAVAPRLVSRASPQALMLAGFGMAATGMAMLSRLGVDSGYALNILPAEVLLGLGTACVMVPAANMATSGVSPREAGIASATLNSAQQIGAAVGIAVLNTVAASATAAYAIASPSATRPETLVHGYAAAALLGTVLLLAGAAVAALVVPRASRDPLKGVWRWRPG
jgi:hypothetical protein